MKILSVTNAILDAVSIVRFSRFCDNRGYFTETYRKSDFINHSEMSFLKAAQFVQVNESYSRPGVVRGLHFQWNPFMGKLVRTIRGRMVDLFLDIRKGSPTYGKIAAYDMPARLSENYSEWIWIPPGFAHGNYFTEETQIEYFCTGEYSQGCEAGISPLSPDLDWSLCDEHLREEFQSLATGAGAIVSDKDKNGFSLEQWSQDERSNVFQYAQLK